MISAFTAPGVTRENVVALREVAEAVQAGDATPEEAAARISELGPILSALWKTLNDNGAALSFIVSAIGLFLLIYYQHLSSDDSAKLLAATQQQTEATRSVEQVEQRIRTELEKQNAVAPASRKRPASTPQLRPPTPPRTPMTGRSNRHERRAEKSKSRRQPSR
jgi:uncharacterized membrane protein YdfJ with MMPL/SSD domain